ncbi:hypothetical protein [Spirosoma aerophilum]
MYYYEKYNVYVMTISFMVLAVLFFILLRKKIFSIIDPLVNNIIWCASSLGLLFGYLVSKNINLDGFSFVSVFFVYIAGLYFFLDTTPRKVSDLEKGLTSKKNTLLFTVCLLLNLGSRLEFISYAIEHPSIASWFLYKFVQYEGRSFWQYILQIGAKPFFIYYLFVLLRTKKEWRPQLIIILIINSLLDIVAGGRSSLLGLLDTYGFFIYYFSPYYTKKSVNRLNWYGISFIIFALINSIIVTSFYSSEGTIEDGVLRMANRILSAGDGLEMYLANNASNIIPSGVLEYSKAAFGIFIKQIIPIETQSVGWQLYEIDSGHISPVSVGPNFILPLQVIILGKFFLIPYTLFISYVVSFLRGNRLSKRLIKSQPLSFVLGILTFQLVIDVEFFVLQLCACLFVYYCFIYPFRKFTLVNDIPGISYFLKRRVLDRRSSANLL